MVEKINRFGINKITPVLGNHIFRFFFPVGEPFSERSSNFCEIFWKHIVYFDLMLIELVSRRKGLRLSAFPCYALWVSLIWGLSYSRENFSPFPCYFFSKIRWNSCVLVCGHDLLSVILSVFWGRTKCACVCVLRGNELLSLCFWSLLSWRREEQDDLYICCA